MAKAARLALEADAGGPDIGSQRHKQGRQQQVTTGDHATLLRSALELPVVQLQQRLGALPLEHEEEVMHAGDGLDAGLEALPGVAGGRGREAADDRAVQRAKAQLDGGSA